MTIKEKTQELGEMIKNSEEFKNLKAAEAVQNSDEKAQELLQEFNLKRMNLARNLHNGEITQEEAIKQSQADFEALAQNEVINAYLEAKTTFDALVEEVNATLNYYITGEQPGGCSCDCSSCGGCH